MTKQSEKMALGRAGKLALLSGVSVMAMGAFAPAMAQSATEVADQEGDTIVVTGVRASLDRAMDIKRNADGVVDAISAEDMGKFPDTNLAESLQRITGVSINRVNGEGSEVTVRGFGPGFNLITLNGRTLPTAEVGVIGARGNYNGGGSRSFDFSNLASEGVASLEVYKTGKATLPTGGIGATVNINTLRPLAGGGTQASVQAKALHDTSVSDGGDDLTPELSGVANWVNEAGNFGVGVFGSYSKRDSGAPTMQVNDWLVYDLSSPGNSLSDNGYVQPGTSVTNPPPEGSLYSVMQDSRYDFSEITRERLNGQLVLQFKPMENLTLSGDYTFAQNESDELRYEQTNWFATPMDELIFSGGPVPSVLYAMEINEGGTKDIGFEQTNRATKDTLDSFGFNADWDFNDNMNITLDAHSSKAKSGGNNPLGHLATFTGIGAPVIAQHSVDFRGGYPIQSYSINDSGRGNNNGVLDAGDVASQVFRSTSTDTEHKVDEVDLSFNWEFDNSNLTVGTNYRDTAMTAETLNTQQELGSWGLAYQGDIEQYAPGVLEEYCLSCEFDDLPVGQAETAFRADAVDLWNALVPVYESGQADPSQPLSRFAITETPGFNEVEEDIFSVYAQFGMEGEFLNRPARFNAGIRYEETEVTSTTEQAIPAGFIWQSDNDFIVDQTGESEAFAIDTSYDHLLPNVDFSMDVRDDLIFRASYSKTIGRAAYTQLYASTTANNPNRPTALGGQLTGTANNPELLPLESDNFDASLEWYYGDTSYVSAGYFKKDTTNFVGTGVVDRNLFGIRDQTAGGAGSRSGDALEILGDLGANTSESNLFTLTAMIDNNGGDLAAAQAEFEANLQPDGSLPQAFVDAFLAENQVASNGDDPLAIYAVQQPINADEGVIDGWEFAWQHFFGDTGFGFAANYTIVEGDITADPAQSPAANEFALVGLSDTANFTAIYENYGFSARLAYNWRDEFLNATNQGGDRSPIFTEAYGQVDLSVSYDVTEQLAVSFEGINLTGEDQRQYHRTSEQFYYGYELSPRYAVGARYSF